MDPIGQFGGSQGTKVSSDATKLCLDFCERHVFCASARFDAFQFQTLIFNLWEKRSNVFLNAIFLGK